MSSKVKIKNVYGVDRIYPVCDNAKLFVELIGNKTFYKSDIAKIKLLGYAVEVESQSL